MVRRTAAENIGKLCDYMDSTLIKLNIFPNWNLLMGDGIDSVIVKNLESALKLA